MFIVEEKVLSNESASISLNTVVICSYIRLLQALEEAFFGIILHGPSNRIGARESGVEIVTRTTSYCFYIYIINADSNYEPQSRRSLDQEDKGASWPQGIYDEADRAGENCLKSGSTKPR